MTSSIPTSTEQKPDEVVRDPQGRANTARIMTAVGDSKDQPMASPDRKTDGLCSTTSTSMNRRWGRMFVRICPYLPFSARVPASINITGLRTRMREEDINFKQWGNAFTKCLDA